MVSYNFQLVCLFGFTFRVVKCNWTKRPWHGPSVGRYLTAIAQALTRRRLRLLWDVTFSHFLHLHKYFIARTPPHVIQLSIKYLQLNL